MYKNYYQDYRNEFFLLLLNTSRIKDRPSLLTPIIICVSTECFQEINRKWLGGV
jgi:hypothetical protein